MRFDLCLCGPRRRAAPPLLALDAGPTSNDPTGTSRIVAQFTQDLDRRWRGVRSAMLAAATKFADPRSTHGSDQVRAFQSWLDETLRTLVVGGTGIWMLKYLQQSEALATSRGKQLVGDVEPQSRIQTLLTMASSELQGICDAVSQQATRAFASGLMTHKVNRRDVADVALNVGRMRGRLLTQFFTVRTFGAATLDTFRAAGVTHVGTRPETKPTRLTTDAKRKKPGTKALSKIFKAESKIQALGEVDVITAGDDKVCPICEDISEDGPYDIDHAESLIPAHINCRCAFVPAGTLNDAFNPDQPRDKDGKWSNNGEEKFTDDDHSAIDKFTGDNPYTNSVGINGSLRHGDTLDEDQQKLVDAVSAAIAKAPRLEKSMIMYRGVDDQAPDVYYAPYGGVTKPDKGFTSLTTDKSVAEHFATSSLKSNRGTIYEIELPAGTRALHVSSMNLKSGTVEPGEYLLERGVSFKPISARQIANLTYVRMTYVPPEQNRHINTRDEFNPNQPRDKYGKWTEGGSTGGSIKAKEFAETLKNHGVSVDEFHDPNAGVHGVSTHYLNAGPFNIAVEKHGVSEHQIEEKGDTLTALFPPDKKLPASAPKEIDFADLTKVGDQKGSNEGGIYKDKDGAEYYVKKPKSKDHVTNELVAAALYKLAGVNTLDYVPVKGGEYVATRLRPLDVDNVSKLTPEQRTQAQSDFAVHAWLANWDAVGTGGDNVGVVDGKVTTLDTGGSLAYRAQGKPKGAAFGNTVTEIDTLRDPSKNPDAAKLYGNMTNDQIAQSMMRLEPLKEKDIRTTVMSHGGSKGLADKVVARWSDLGTQYDKFANAPPPVAAPPPAAQTSDHPSLALKKFVAGTSAERVTMRKHLTTIPNNSDDAKTTKLKIIASFWKQHDALTKKNSPKTAELASKLAQYAAKYKISNPLVVSTVVPTTANTTTTKFFKPAPVQKAKLQLHEEKANAFAKDLEAQGLKPTITYKPEINSYDVSVPNDDEDNLEKFTDVAEKHGFNAGSDEVSEVDVKYTDNEDGIYVRFEPNTASLPDIGHKPNAEEKQGLLDLVSALGDKAAGSFVNFAQSKKLPPGVTVPDIAHIAAYTGSHYASTNEALRAGTMTEDRWRHVDALNTALRKLPPYVGTTYRKVSLPEASAAKYVVGNVVVDPQFLSTSKSSNMWHGSFKFTIHGKNGRDVQPYSVHSGEQEVLFPSGSRFKVVSRSGNEIELREV